MFLELHDASSTPKYLLWSASSGLDEIKLQVLLV